MPIVSERPPRLSALTSGQLLKYFENTWELTELLFSSIFKPGALYDNPDKLRHPLAFYLGHTAAFYVNKLSAVGAMGTLNACFESLFAQGVDPKLPSDLPQKIRWPDETDIRRYREAVFLRVRDALARISVDDTEKVWALLMCIEHERLHFETSSVLIRQYPLDVLSKPPSWEYAPTEHPVPRRNSHLLHVPAGNVLIGKDSKIPTFGWDNEYGHLEVSVPAFVAGRDLVTNGEFLEFVLDNGYSRDALWTKAGNCWRQYAGAGHPRFWIPTADGEWLYRAMFDVLPLPMSWPVEVNFHEVNAFCQWKGRSFRPLAEKEFRAIARQSNLPDGDLTEGNAFNINLKFGSPCPVGLVSREAEDIGFSDVHGNVWTWLSDNFYPLPGFKEHNLYPDFSVPFFDDEHRMMRGASWASTGSSASEYYRLWFRPHFFQHAGFRIAADA